MNSIYLYSANTATTVPWFLVLLIVLTLIAALIANALISLNCHNQLDERIRYEKRDDGFWQCSWWERHYRYGAAGYTKEKALENALSLQKDGKVIEIDWISKLAEDKEQAEKKFSSLTIPWISDT